MMMYNFYYIIIFLSIYAFVCEREFDDLARPVNTVIDIKVIGYRNIGNRGVTKGCCLNSVRRICQPCRMMYVLFQKSSFLYRTKYSTIAVWSKEAEALYERYDVNFLFSAITYNQVKITIFTFNSNKTIHEEYPMIETSILTKYAYRGAYGINNIIELWAEMIFRPYSLVPRYMTTMIRIDSIYIKEYRTFDGLCCTGVQDDECPDECGYSLDWKLSTSLIESSSALTPNTRSRLQNISITLASTSFNLNKDNINFRVYMYSSLERIMDYIITPTIVDLPNVERKLVNARGVYGNAIFNISWMHTCQRYSGINCKLDCYADYGTEFCDIDSGQSRCLNGATDQNSCVNLAKNCNADTCSKKGVCQLVSGVPTCNCNPGYTGRFCQDWQCDSRCNGNGECIGPNSCDCRPPYTGNNCEEYPCDKVTAQQCGLYGFCKLIAGSISCSCFNKLITGANCTTAICAHECIFGKCVYNSRLDMTNCVCDPLYEGISCNVVKKNLNPTNNSANYGAPVAILVIVIILLVLVSGLIFKGIIFIDLSKYNMQDEHKDRLESTNDA